MRLKTPPDSRSSENVQAKDGTQYHLGLKTGDLEKTVVLVGDPARLEKFESRFDTVRVKKGHREFLTISGEYQGHPLSVMATGIGQGNMEIACIEACQVQSQISFLRCGTCSALQPQVPLGSLVISTGAMGLGNLTEYYAPPTYPAIANSDIAMALSMAVSDMGLPLYQGITASAPGFYGPQGREVPGLPLAQPHLIENLINLGLLNFEMEAETLFKLASLKGLRAGMICAAIGNRAEQTFLDARELVKAEEHAIEATLRAVTCLSWLDEDKKTRGLSTWIPKRS